MCEGNRMDEARLFQRCTFAGSLWTIVFINHSLLNLVSIDGKQFKQGIDRSMVQLIDEFADCYPEE